MTAVLLNPVDAARTAALMGIEGSAAFGAASLALLRFTGGVWQAVALAVASVTLWAIVPLMLAARRLARADV
jgi:Cu-processing system permease protein